MKWDIDLRFTISQGRKQLFNLSKLWPFSLFNKRHEKNFVQCYRKQRYRNEQEAQNHAWFSDNSDHKKKFDSYQCPVCDGWHLTTHKNNHVQ